MVSLGLIVWIIYTVDHLVDARKSTGVPATERHRFHQRNAIPLTGAVIIAGAIIALEALFVRKPVLYAGLGVAILVVIYLLLQAGLRFFKEIAGAILYTAGIVAAPWSLAGHPLSSAEWMLIKLFACVALTNLLVFSWFDRETDTLDNHHSFATTFGSRATRLFILALALLIGALSAEMILSESMYTGAVATLMTMDAILLCILLLPGYFSRDDRYRRLGDSIFLIPLVYLLLSR